MRKKIGVSVLVAGVVAAIAWAGGARAQDITLAEKGEAKCIIVALAGWANDLVLPPEVPAPAASLLRERRVLYRDSIKDLALYLGKMSGTRIEVIEGLPDKDERGRTVKRRIWLRVLDLLILTGRVGAGSPAGDPESVDEPLGARYSLGMTLWHLGHNDQKEIQSTRKEIQS